MKKIIILFSSFLFSINSLIAVNAFFYETKINYIKNNFDIILEKSLYLSLCLVNDELAINDKAFESRIIDYLDKSFNNYSFTMLKVKIGYIRNEYYIKGVSVCLIIQKNLWTKNIKRQLLIKNQ